MYKNPRSHAVNLLTILQNEPHWEATIEEVKMVAEMIERFDRIMEEEELLADSRAYADFCERAYGNEREDYNL